MTLHTEAQIIMKKEQVSKPDNRLTEIIQFEWERKIFTNDQSCLSVLYKYSIPLSQGPI